jgi:beta-lactamase superfamily II metal-dependent hydrolase
MADGKSTFVFWNVDHGHATYLNSPNDRHIAVDLGTGQIGSGQDFYPLRHLHRNGVDRLDHLCITHPHRDHIDDILNVEDVRPKVFHRPRHLDRDDVFPDELQEGDREKYEKYLNYDENFVHPVPDRNDISNPDAFGGLRAQFFTPPDTSASNLNNHSMVAVFHVAGRKVVVPGDNEAGSLDGLMGRSFFQRAVEEADILLAPHHGRESGYHEDFVELVDPILTVISDGRYSDTSETAQYSHQSSGMTIERDDGSTVSRNVVTTRNDGVISATVSSSGSLSVRIKPTS